MTLFFLTACQIPYLLTNSYHQLEILSQRVSIEKTLKEKKLPRELRYKLLLSQKAKKFAEHDLNLQSSQNYSTYVKLNRPYVTYVVNAAPKFQLKNHLWQFPIVGQVPYKGFFNESDAKDLSSELRSQGLDTHVRGVSAYSTLGWFDDPLLSSMMRYSRHDLVNTIIHETVHATLYIKNNARFNERLATYIGNLGTQLFYLKTEGPKSPTLRTLQREQHDQKLFSLFISAEIKNLNRWYKSTQKKTLALKEKKLHQLQMKFKRNTLPKMKTSRFVWFSQNPLNNAKLMLLNAYIGEFSYFEKLYQKHGKNFQLFLKACKSLESSSQPMQDLKKSL